MTEKNTAAELEVKNTDDAQGHEEELDSIMQELETLEQDLAEPAKNNGHTRVEGQDSVVPLRAARGKANPVLGKGATQSLTLELTGTLNLKLAFITGSKSVELICTEDSLICRFGDGTEVRIPTDNPKAASIKRSA